MEKMLVALVAFALLLGCAAPPEGTALDAGKNDTTLLSLARSANDLSQCGKIKSAEIRGWCFRDVGIALESTPVCDMAGNVPDKYSCYIGISDKKAYTGFCFNDVAKAFPGMASAVDDCLVRVAYVQGNESVCDLLNDKGNMNGCLGTARHYV